MQTELISQIVVIYFTLFCMEREFYKQDLKIFHLSSQLENIIQVLIRIVLLLSKR